MKIPIEVNEEVYNEACDIYESLGLNFEMAVSILLNRTVSEKRLPFDMSINVPVVEVDEFVEIETDEIETKNVTITQDMIEDVWDRFDEYCKYDLDIHELASEINEFSGMSSGSAFIYLVFLNNLIKGQHNTRNMKFSDLQFFMERIKDEMSDEAFKNAKKSLRASIPYWNKKVFGKFAEKVSNYLDELETEN